MNIEGVKEFYSSFKCELLTSKTINKEDIKEFSSNVRNSRVLEEYLKTDAWLDNDENETRTYIIREPNNNKLVFYFSIRCGMTYTTSLVEDEYRQLKSPEKRLVDFIMDSLIKGNSIENIELKYRKVFSNFKYLKAIAEERKRSKKGFVNTEDFDDVTIVENCYPAIELQYFCRCDDYKAPVGEGFKLGFGLFWQVIVPKILELSQQIGSKYLYLFAADRSEDKSNQHLINYYNESLMFGKLDDLGLCLLKPAYNKGCVGLIQPINSLVECRNSAWDKFSDYIEEAT